MAQSAACSEIAAAKTALRKRVLRARGAMSAAARAAASARICAALLRAPELTEAKVVAAFAPMAEEVDIRPLLAECRRAGKQVALPRVCGRRRLVFHFVNEEQVAMLRPGYKNILQPEENFPVAPPQTFDFAIIPAVAVDSRLARLGYGGGFYDTLLSVSGFRAVSCAAVFRCQRVPEVPAETHDRRVKMVFSE